MRTPAGSLCKAVARYFCTRPLGRFAKQWRAIFAHARWVLLQSRSALFCARPTGRFCKTGARYFCARPPGRFVKQRRIFCARRAASLPRLSAVRARPSTARSGPHSLPSVHPRARPLSPGHGSVSSAPACPPPRAPTLPSVFSVSPARPRHHPLFHTVRPAAAPVSPCAAPPFPPPFLIQRASIAKENAVRTNAARRAASLPAPPV